jgi:hypothetical protein
MSRVIHFEIHADNPERAINFYKSVLGWGFQKWDGPEEYYLITTGPDDQPGINGGLIKRRGTVDGNAVIAYVCTVEIPNIEEYLEKIKNNNGQIVVPKMPIPGVGWLAYAKDTEGNIFGVMQNDPSAK